VFRAAGHRVCALGVCEKGCFLRLSLKDVYVCRNSTTGSANPVVEFFRNSLEYIFICILQSLFEQEAVEVEVRLLLRI